VDPGLGPAGRVVDPERPQLTLGQAFFIFSLGSAIGNGFTPCRIASMLLELPFEANEASKMTKSWRVAPMPKKLPYMV
jgi:hypothetical protein